MSPVPVTGVMAARDANIARLTLEALWSSTLASAREGSGGPRDPGSPSLTEGLRASLRQCFEGGPKDAAYVACLQSFALADRGFAADVDKAAQAATACASLQAGALQVWGVGGHA